MSTSSYDVNCEEPSELEVEVEVEEAATFGAV